MNHTAQESKEVKARVSAVYRGGYSVLWGGGEVAAKLKTSGYFRDAAMEFPTVGDYVLLQYNPAGDSLITKTLERRTLFCRSDWQGSHVRHGQTVLRQPIAANFDTVFIVMALNADFNLRRTERYLAQCRQSGAAPVVVLNKADLVESPAPYTGKVEAIAPGVTVIPVSAATGLGMEALAPYAGPGQTVVLLGSSGVGKSSIVNALCGEAKMQVNSIREDDSKGRHTTTHRQMIPLAGGGVLIDTPGMRELGLVGAEEGLDEAFADVTALFGLCRYADCRHRAEPGCGVRRALEAGALEEERWESYLRLQKENAFAQKRAEVMQRLETGRGAKRSFQSKKTGKRRERPEEY